MGDAPQRIVQLIVFSMEKGGPLLFLSPATPLDKLKQGRRDECSKKQTIV